MKFIKKLSKKFSHPNYLFLGGFLITVGVYLLSGYSLSQSWSEANSAVTFVAFVIVCPFIWLFIGVILGLANGLGAREEYTIIKSENSELMNSLNTKEKEILEKDNEVNRKIEEIKRLSSSINGYQENIQDLNNQIYELQNDIAVGWLKHIFKLFKMNSMERVSIYFEQDEVFILLARYSVNPHYKKSHRQKFPLNQGVISQAWSYGEKIENQCPKYEGDGKEYFKYMSDTYAFRIEDLQSFYMKSCWYVAIAISKADDNLGVIVFESINENILNDTDIKALISYCKENQSYLAEFIEKSKALELAKRMRSAGADGAENDILSSLSGGGRHE
ncbi:MAG: coiled-coil domain-containing protein [Acinetobacter amyesii]|uniref:coiled-coil domain-containing protein n=1 Tax=Acinetobacter amyesii TaxID=2942470 RepID=UPI003D06223A